MPIFGSASVVPVKIVLVADFFILECRIMQNAKAVVGNVPIVRVV